MSNHHLSDSSQSEHDQAEIIEDIIDQRLNKINDIKTLNFVQHHLKEEEILNSTNDEFLSKLREGPNANGYTEES